MDDLSKRIAGLSPKKLELLLKRLGQEADGRPPAVIGKRVDRGSPAPLSFAQERLWFIERLEPDSASYNLATALRIRGDLSIAALEQSITEVVRRHEILRTRLETIKGQTYQIAREPGRFDVNISDLTHLDDAAREAKARLVVSEEAKRPFNLKTGPLLRVTLLKLGEADHVVALTMHHIISDGWSLGLFVEEFGALYRAYSDGQPSPLQELPIQYSDFASWQREVLKPEVLEGQLQYWVRQLAGAPPLLELRSDKARPPVRSHRGKRQRVAFDAGLRSRLKQFSRQREVTLFMTLMTAFNIVLHFNSKGHDLVVGTDVANRSKRATERLIGMFVNEVAIRTDLSGDPRFVDLLGRVKESALGAYANQDIPFEKVVEALKPERSLSYTPVIQVKLVVMEGQSHGLQVGNLNVSMLEVEAETAQMDLIINLTDTEQGLVGNAEYSTDIWEPASISRLVRQFEFVLRRAIEDPQLTLTELELLLSKAEEQEWDARHRELDEVSLQKFKKARRKIEAAH